MKNTLLFFTLLLFVLKANSKQIDTLIFNNDFEKKIFVEYINTNKIEPLNLLLAINYSDKALFAKEKLNDFCKELEGKGIRGLNTKKKIKEIFKRTHAAFLQKYTEDVCFSDIFINGNYNCVTASALYALVFDYFQIEYLIKKTPQHVYLVADPKGEQVAIETTLPTKGIFVYDERFVKGYVEYLKENKLISENEYRTKPINELFEQHYNKATTIDFLQLASLQYYNKCIFLIDLLDYKEALKNLEKAEILFQDNSIKFLLSNVLINVLSEQNSSKKYNGGTLAKYLNANKKSSLSTEYVSDYFKMVSNELVINRPNINGYKQFFKDFTSLITDSINTNDYHQTYNALLGYYYYTSSNYSKALFHYGNSYNLNSENIATKQVILELILKKLTTNLEYEDKLDSLEMNVKKFPFLTDNSNFQIFFVGSYASAILNCFERGSFADGKQILSQLEKCIKDNNLQGAYSDPVSTVYTQIASTYYRLHYYENQEEILKRGLDLFPNSRMLQSSMKSFLASKKELMAYALNNHYQTKEKPYSINNESLNIIKTESNKNRNKINLNVDKFLKNKSWRLESVVIGERIVNLTPKEQSIFTLQGESQAKIKDVSGEREGKWSYNRGESTLRLFDSKDSATTNIMIFEIDSTIIKSIMHNDGSSNKIISILKSF